MVDDDYRAGVALVDVGRAIAAITFLVSGKPLDFDRTIVSEGLALVPSVFREGLLRDHAIAALAARPVERDGAVRWTGDHLAVLGARTLFVSIVHAMTLRPAARTYSAQLTAAVVPHLAPRLRARVDTRFAAERAVR